DGGAGMTTTEPLPPEVQAEVDEAQPPGKVIGTRMLRREDPALLAGEARYTDDLVVPNALSIAVVRSPYAHARITNVDVSGALAMPGVRAAFSGADLLDEWAAPMPMAWAVSEDLKNPPHYPLTPDVARYVGD